MEPAICIIVGPCILAAFNKAAGMHISSRIIYIFISCLTAYKIRQ